MVSNFLRYGLVLFMVLAGINHFLSPEFYIALIPKYLPNHGLINVISGILEIILALGMLLNKGRIYFAYGLILLLVAFIPSHIHFIQLGGCVDSGLCTPLWVAHLRLWLIHPLLITWVWLVRK